MNEYVELKSIIKTIDLDLIHDYAKASGDYNPIHIDKEFGENSQFKNNIAHGMMVAASISEFMALNFGLDWYKSGTMKIKFKEPVFPNDTIITSGTITKTTIIKKQEQIACKVTVTNQNGVIAISGDTSIFKNKNESGMNKP